MYKRQLLHITAAAVRGRKRKTMIEFSYQPATRRSEAEREAALVDPGFGKVFTDHMVSISWTREQGWHDAKVMPYGPIPMDPAASVLHYGQEIFEGVKAYRHPNGDIVTFRPEANAQRLNESAKRLVHVSYTHLDVYKRQ